MPDEEELEQRVTERIDRETREKGADTVENISRLSGSGNEGGSH